MFFISRFSKKLGRKVGAVSLEAMDRLMRYPRPGNIRELQNLIERALVLSQGSVLTLQRDLFPAAGFSQPSVATAVASVSPASATGHVISPIKGSVPAPAPTLEEVERRHILEVLNQTGWIIEGSKGAAKILSLHPNTLRSRMQKLGIQRSKREPT